MADKPNFGLTGLAVMGQNLARNVAHKGFPIAVHNRTTEKTDKFMEEHGGEGQIVGSKSVEEFVGALQSPRAIMIMVKAGRAVDDVIAEIKPLLAQGDLLIDGGNSLFSDTERRVAEMAQDGILFLGAGVSGGEEGALNGPSIMPGGTEAAYKIVEPIFTKIAAQVDGTPCCTYIGDGGAGHYVKMVHNGIEYADMQLIGEAYDLIRRGTGKTPAEIADIFTEWNTGELESYLIEITAEVLRQVDASTGKPLVDVILDQAGSKGTGVWTVQTSLDLGIPVSGIAEAVFARSVSSKPAQRAAAAELPGPTASPVQNVDGFIEGVRQALYASKVIAYSQGFDAIVAGAEQYDWDIEKGEIAKIWRGGCIIRARFLNRITEAYAENPSLVSLVTAPFFTDVVAKAQDSWRNVVADAAHAGIPAPVFASSLAYYDSLRADRLPAALTQGQRDFFGAHTYKRIDREGTFHTLWSGDRTEIETEGSSH